LLILAALSYSEVGKVADSDFFIGRLVKRFELSPGEWQMIRFIELKNSYVLGSIDVGAFLTQIDWLLQQSPSPENQVTLRLNKLHFQLAGLKGFHSIPPELPEEINQLARVIDEMEESTHKYFLRLWNLENLAIYAGLVRAETLNQIVVSDQFGQPISHQERLARAKAVVMMQHIFSGEISTIDQYAERTQNQLLRAYSIMAKLRAKLSLQIDLIVSDTDPNELEAQDRWLEYNIQLAAEGFRIFLDHNQLNQAYTLLCISAELHVIMVHWGGWRSPVLEDMLQSNFELLENELEIPPFQSKVMKLIDRKKAAGLAEDIPNQGMRGLLDLDDRQIENAVEMTLRTGKFPNAKKEFMMLEMQSFRLFFQRCQDTEVYPVVVDPPAIDRVYTYAPRYQLINKRTGIVSLKSENMDQLLSAWGY
jgi:hypothetical protein